MTLFNPVYCCCNYVLTVSGSGLIQCGTKDSDFCFPIIIRFLTRYLANVWMDFYEMFRAGGHWSGKEIMSLIFDTSPLV